MKTISTEEARRRFSELVSLAYYKGAHTPIARNKQQVAWIVGEPFMRGLGEFFSYLEENHPALADTLALLADENLRGEVEQGLEAYWRGEAFPIEHILDD